MAHEPSSILEHPINEPADDSQAPKERLTQHEYLASPTRCPQCHAEEGLDADPVAERAMDTLIQKCWCTSCGFTWTDVYKLERYEADNE